MPHHSAFIITSLSVAHDRVPSDTELRRAAEEVQKMATALIECYDPASSNDPRPESLAIGCQQYRFIQGNGDTNHNTFAGKPIHLWPDTTFEFWSDRQGTFAHAADAPQQILDWSWNTTGRLVTLALESSVQTRLRPYPSLVIAPDDTPPLHHLRYHDCDIFGDDTPGLAASNYVTGDPVIAWHRAKSPIQELAEATFRVDYLQLLHRLPDLLVMELDWNL